MPGHPVHPVQPAQSPAQPTQSVHMPPPPLHSSVHPARRPHDDPTGDVVRWAAFSCLLVPVVLVVYGTSFGGAAVATLGLAAVTAACRVLLRHSENMERNAARVPSEDRSGPSHRGRRSRAGVAAQRGCHGSGGMSPHD